MNHLIVICNLETLDKNKLSTSSSKYECEFAFDMATKVNKVSVVSPNARCQEETGNIELVPCAKADLTKNISPLINSLNDIVSDDGNVVVHFFGYNPKLIFALRKFRKQKHNVKISATVYDTHLGELKNKPFVKQIIICLYFNLGLILLKKIDYLILFKKSAERRLKIKNKALVVLPSVNPLEIKPYTPTFNSHIKFLYSGTLCEYNCIRQLLNAFGKLNVTDAELEIFGDGPLEKYVCENAEKDNRVSYFGRISNDRLNEYITKADVMINLRSVPSVVNDYAFPSKVVEYMKAGKAVISTDISEYEDFNKSVFLVKPLSEAQLLSVMSQICENTGLINEKVNNSKLYLEKYHNNKTIAEQIFCYLFADNS